jgi:two-component system phosphate regulon sensor histidine kinase PhoR
MSLSLVGIILVQLYWVNSSLKIYEEQFRYHIQQVLERVTKKLEKNEVDEFYKVYQKYYETYSKKPSRQDLIAYYGHNENQSIVYSDKINRENYSDVFFDTSDVQDYINNKNDLRQDAKTKKKKIKAGDAEKFYQIELFLEDFRHYNYLESWLTSEKLREILAYELSRSYVSTSFEFAVYNNGLATKIKSANLTYDPAALYDRQIFEDSNNESHYRLLVSFPEKQTYLFSSIVNITSLSLVFTLIIIIAYMSAINQLIKQKQISEIKTDFINNMTHEFKTPIATINLALDAIKNPKIFEDKEKVQRYLQMIKDENKRMHAQVENVLQISKLDKKELEIVKEQADIQEVLEGAIEHVHLIIETRQGTLTRHYGAQRTTALLNEVHFTNVLVNILDNAIKYSPDEPVIDIYTENVKDFILIKIQDKGLGMSKITQKRIFEKFYREHTGDIHNVKGHGLGLAYVKRIVDDHNCHIYVESEKGKGSTFIIKMPLIN